MQEQKSILEKMQESKEEQVSNKHIMDPENPLALILAGQTELWEKLRLQAYRAILHRVDIQCFLMPYEYAQTKVLFFFYQNLFSLKISCPIIPKKVVKQYHGNLQMYYDNDSGTFHTIITLKQ